MVLLGVLSTICAGCRGANLQGAIGPALAGPGLQVTWRNAMALWSFVSQNMPLGRPGSLAREEYCSVVAYLLRRNGIEPDGEALSEETAERLGGGSNPAGGAGPRPPDAEHARLGA